MLFAVAELLVFLVIYMYVYDLINNESVTPGLQILYTAMRIIVRQ